MIDMNKEINDYLKNIKQLKQGTIPNDWIVKTVEAKNEVIVTASSMKQRCAVKRIDKTHYELLSTHEIREYRKHSDNTRKANTRSLQKSLSHLRNLINNNFVGGKNEVWITLTYRKTMRDDQQARYDVKQLLKKLRRKYAVGDEKLEYIYILEPQKSGSWHIHLLLKLTNTDTLYIPQYRLKQAWGHGSARVNSAKNGINNIANYLTALLQNAKSTQQEEYEIKTKLGLKASKPTKKYEKYSRLKYYRRGMSFYSRSKGIKEPVQRTLKYSDIKKELDEGQFIENFKKVSSFKTTNNTVITTVFIQFYKSSIADTAKINKRFKFNAPPCKHKGEQRLKMAT